MITIDQTLSPEANALNMKFVELICLAALFASAVIGCDRPEAPEAKPQTFSVLYNEREAIPFREDWLILEEYRKRRNVLLDIRTGDDADFDRAILQTLESGNIPDIILKVWPETIERDAAVGLLLPFSEYEQHLPHFLAYIEERDLREEVDTLRLDNGKYYILPGFQRAIQVQQWAYRRDLFETHELGIPETYDELYEALVHLKQIYPDSLPITACWGGAHLFAMMGAGYGIPAGWAGVRDYHSGEDRWQFAPASENYRALLRFLHRCYNAKILDPAIFTQSTDEYHQKVQDGRAFVIVTWVTAGFRFWNEQLRENGISDGEWAALPVPESTLGITALPPVDRFRKGLIVPARVLNEPYFDDLLAFLDWAVYSEEGRTLTAWGVEGITFENTSHGNAFLPAINSPTHHRGTLDMTKDYGLNTLFDLNEHEAYEDTKRSPEITEFLANSLQAGETAKPDPRLPLDAGSLEAERIIAERIEPYIAQSRQDFITGALRINEEWDAYIEELENRGYTTLEDIWNAAWQKRMVE